MKNQTSKSPRTKFLNIRLSGEEYEKLEQARIASGDTNVTQTARRRILAPMSKGESNTRLRDSIEQTLSRCRNATDRLIKRISGRNTENDLQIEQLMLMCSNMLSAITRVDTLLRRLIDGPIPVVSKSPSLDLDKDQPTSNIPLKYTNLQRITVCGQIINEPSLNTQNNKSFVSFSLMVDFTIGEEQKKAYYLVNHPDTELVNSLKKGDVVFLSGNLEASMTVKDGNPNISLLVKADPDAPMEAVKPFHEMCVHGEVVGDIIHFDGKDNKKGTRFLVNVKREVGTKIVTTSYMVFGDRNDTVRRGQKVYVIGRFYPGLTLNENKQPELSLAVAIKSIVFEDSPINEFELFIPV